MAGDSSEKAYRNPTPTVDVLIELDGRPGTLVFIERAHEPVGWALPGGFVDYGETLAAAAVREAKEETGLDVEPIELFHCYSDPARDARKHTVSTVFIVRAAGVPVGADDAARAAVAPGDAPPGRLVFDHATIVHDYLVYKRTGRRPPPRR
jgi:8-oxo-dGTP diphosphatase